MHGIAQFAFQIIAAQQSVVFEVPDDGFDGIAAFEGAFESPGVSANNSAQKPPSVRYFQIHFEFLHEQLQSLQKNQEALQLQLMKLERLLLQREHSPASKVK